MSLMTPSVVVLIQKHERYHIPSTSYFKIAISSINLPLQASICTFNCLGCCPHHFSRIFIIFRKYSGISHPGQFQVGPEPPLSFTTNQLSSTIINILVPPPGSNYHHFTLRSKSVFDSFQFIIFLKILSITDAKNV